MAWLFLTNSPYLFLDYFYFMKLNKIILFAVAAGLATLSFAPGKKKSFEGKILFEITYEELPEMLEPYRAMLPKETTTYIKGTKSRVEQNTMGQTIVNVTDSEKKTGFMLMDGMGEKTAYTIESKDFESENKKSQENVEVTYTKETKDISGYKCTKVEIKDKKEGNTVFAWVTEDIQGASKQYSYLKGFPLEYSINAQMGMTMVMKAKTIEKMKVADSYFEIPKDYAKKPMSELQKQMEQMQNGGSDDE